jgi:hypothetical protein
MWNAEKTGSAMGATLQSESCCAAKNDAAVAARRLKVN